MFSLWQGSILLPRTCESLSSQEHHHGISSADDDDIHSACFFPIVLVLLKPHDFPIQQMEHWKQSHKYQCKPDQYIPGTRVKTDTTPAPNPLDPSLEHPKGRTGRTRGDPLQGIMGFKYENSGKPKARLIKPGKLTPFINKSFINDPIETEFPYEQLPNQQVSMRHALTKEKYRHIATFSLEELCKLGWDGATYQGHTFEGEWVPFVSGYDSDPEHEYEDFDIAVAKRNGIVGQNDEGKYMVTPGIGGKSSIVQLKVPRKGRQPV